MKRLLQSLMVVLALNFLALLGGVGWLYRSGHLDRQRISSIKAILFPTTAPAAQPAAPTTQAAATQPSLPLAQLLAAKAGLNASEQVEFLQRSFDSQMMALDRKRRDAQDLLDEVRKEQAVVTQQRQALDIAAKTLAAEQAASAKLASDKGFQESLDRYSALPAKTVKQIFVQLDDTTVMHYLEAMEPRNAAGIIKEYKTPAEIARIHQVLEMMRTQAATEPSNGAPSGASAGGQNASGIGPNSAASATP